MSSMGGLRTAYNPVSVPLIPISPSPYFERSIPMGGQGRIIILHSITHSSSPIKYRNLRRRTPYGMNATQRNNVNCISMSRADLL
mgnify:FL=1|jgi:hypothetical protein